MLEIINAILPPMNEPSFDSPTEAIEFSKEKSRSWRNSDLLSGVDHVITSVDWSIETLSLHLDNHDVIRFSCGPYGVELSREVEALPGVRRQSQASDIALIRLAGAEFHWNRGEIGKALCGNIIQVIQPTQSNFFLNVKNNDIIFVSILIDSSNGQPVLVWQPYK